jgi:hypothetical protein
MTEISKRHMVRIAYKELLDPKYRAENPKVCSGKLTESKKALYERKVKEYE